MRIVLTVLLLQALIVTVILHVISGTFWMTANWNPSPSDSGIERQRYIQSARESGTILIGVRSQPTKQSNPSSYKLNIEGPKAGRQRTTGNPGKENPWTMCVGYPSPPIIAPNSNFTPFI